MNEQIKLIYISGPITAPSEWEVTQHIWHARKMQARLLKMPDTAVYCPHTMYEGMHGLLSYNAWIKRDLEILRRCEGVVVLKGWETSKGTMEEIGEAGRCNIPVWYESSKYGEVRVGNVLKHMEVRLEEWVRRL